MTFGSNTGTQTHIRAEVRKSFSFGVWLKDHSGRLLDLSETTLRIVAKDPRDRTQDDSTNLIVNSVADIVSPVNGYARFNLQASDLDHPIGEYDYSVVLLDRGYSSVLFKGTLSLEPNTEFTSVGDVYDEDQPVQTMQVILRGRQIVEVKAGPALAPGSTTFLFSDKTKLDGIEEGAQVNIHADWTAGPDDPAFIFNKPALGTAAYRDVEDISIPPGGSPGEVLTKRSASNQDVVWQQPTGGGGGGGAGLDATGVEEGKIPTATGVDGWGWQDPPADRVTSVNGKEGAVNLTLDDIAETVDNVTITAEQRTKLDGLTATPDWEDIENKPAFGGAALLEENEVLQPGGVDADDVSSGVLDPARIPQVSTLPGFSSGTSAPAGGADGDLYFQYVI